MAFQDTRRGDIWFANDGMGPRDDASHATYGNRPVVVVSSNRTSAGMPVITVVPLTSSPKKLETVEDYPTRVLLNPMDGPTVTSVAMTEQVTSVDRADLDHFINTVSPEAMRRIDAALKAHLGF